MGLNTLGNLSFGMPGRGPGGFRVTFQNGEALSRAFAKIESGLRKQAQGEMRTAAQEIAKSLIPSIKAFAAMSPMPIAPALADTAMAKRDRMVMVQVGGRNPRLSGFKRGVGIKRATERTTVKLKGGRPGTSANYRTTLAWASEKGPYPGSKWNRYRVPRRESGYYVAPAINSHLRRAIREYEIALDKIIYKYGSDR